jgi:hypothetical protein
MKQSTQSSQSAQRFKDTQEAGYRGSGQEWKFNRLPAIDFTRWSHGRYNLRADMRHRRHPTALDNPKISIVIPAYNEKPTVLRRANMGS